MLNITHTTVLTLSCQWCNWLLNYNHECKLKYTEKVFTKCGFRDWLLISSESCSIWGGQKNLVQKKPFQKSFTKDSALAYMLQQCFDQLWDHPFVTPSPPPAMLCTKKDSFPSISFTSQHCLWWESLKFYWYHWRVPNTSDLLCSLSSTLKSNIFTLSMKWS